MNNLNDFIQELYNNFNDRKSELVISHLTADVKWANGMEGGHVYGHSGVREYWTRQWKEIDPFVEPLAINLTKDGKIEVEVHQVAMDKDGKLLFDGNVKHIYSFQNELIKGMEIDDN